MKKINILVIFLTLFPCIATYGKECEGTNLRDIEEQCDTITKSPLIIDQEDVGSEKAKLKGKNIKRIEAGLEVRYTNLITFDLLPNVEHIGNDIGGPAIEFQGNSRLEHLKFPNLQSLEVFEDDEIALCFSEQDHYPGFVYSNADEFKNLLRLEAIFRKQNAPKKCSDKFLHIEPVVSTWPFWVAFGVSVSVLFVFTVLNVLSCYNWRKEKKAQKESSQPSSITKSIKGRIVPKLRKNKN